MRSAIHHGLIGVLLAIGMSSPSESAERRPIVVELFTSQGCSSCPPANANLIELGRRGNVLTLSYSVTYWDYLGWKDTFGNEAFTDRQVTYEPALGKPGPFTPQMVINGRISTVGNRLAEVEALLGAAVPEPGPEMALAEGYVTIGRGKAPSERADVWVVRYEPKLLEVPVARGENKGRVLPHSHVVRDLARLGQWDGTDTRLAIAKPVGALRTAILLQEKNGGPIIAAITD